MLTIITNPIILSVIILVALCLLKVNVFLAIILSSLICAVLGGASVTEGLTMFYENMGNDDRMVLFLLLLGVLATTMQYNNVGEVLAPRVAKIIGNRVWLFPIVLTVLAIIAETFVLVGVSFLLVIIPPLLKLLTDYKIDRRLLVITTCCGLQMGYCCFPVGYGLAFMGIIQTALAENGLEVTIDEIWKANIFIAVAMLIAITLAMFKYRKPREYDCEDGENLLEEAEREAKSRQLPPIEFRHIACLIAAASVVVIQVTTDSMPLAALVMIAVLVITGAIKIKDFDSVFMKGIMTSVYVCPVLMAAVAFAAVSKEYGQLDSLINASAELIGGSKVFGAFFMLILGLFITMGIGSSFSTVPIVATVLVPLGVQLGMSHAAIILLVAASGALGDSGAPSSNQTLIPTSAFNIDGQHDHIKDSCIPSFLFVNIPLIIVCAIVGCII